jgi:hypothetical protein
MHPNLFVSVLLALFTGFTLGAIVFVLLAGVSRLTRRPSVVRIVPGLLVLSLCLSVFRFTDSIRTFLDRLHYQYGLNRLVVLALMTASLAVGFQIAFQVLRGARRRPE